ncbi:MAG: hypothetical protein ACKOW3_02215 [Hyphomicrobium sp.]
MTKYTTLLTAAALATATISSSASSAQAGGLGLGMGMGFALGAAMMANQAHYAQKARAPQYRTAKKVQPSKKVIARAKSSNDDTLRKMVEVKKEDSKTAQAIETSESKVETSQNPVDTQKTASIEEPKVEKVSVSEPLVQPTQTTEVQPQIQRVAMASSETTEKAPVVVTEAPHTENNNTTTTATSKVCHKYLAAVGGMVETPCE